MRKFDKFLKENDAKRVRANRKAQDEIKLREQKELERQVCVKLVRYSSIAVWHRAQPNGKVQDDIKLREKKDLERQVEWE